MVSKKTREVISVDVLDPNREHPFDYTIEARLYRADKPWKVDKWLIGEEDSAALWAVYPEEIDAYIELFTAMKEASR